MFCSINFRESTILLEYSKSSKELALTISSDFETLDACAVGSSARAPARVTNLPSLYICPVPCTFCCSSAVNPAGGADFPPPPKALSPIAAIIAAATGGPNIPS